MGKGKKEIYLSRRGKIFGPHDSTEIETMRASGKIDEYSHIWEPPKAIWQPIDPPPATPPRTATHPLRNDPGTSWQALCHDTHYTLVSGTLHNLSETGCELVTDDPAASPRLALGAPLLMNVWDPLHRKSMDLNVQVSDVLRQEGCWIYRVEWTSSPPKELGDL